MIQKVLSRRSAKISAWFRSEYNLMSNAAGTFQHECNRAAIIVIGDEILKGQVQDSNSHYIAKQLHSLGVKLDKISVIPDSVDAISREVRFHSEHYDFVVTTGGIGPTHDDVTFQGVAAAFNDTTALRPEIQHFVSEYFKTDDITQPCFKLAQVPTSARLLYGEDRARGIKSRFPVVQIRNVYVFPGVPSLLERAFALLAKDQFASECTQFHCDAVYVSLDEVSIASILNRVVEQYPEVTFGSYPVFYHSYYKTRISIEAVDSDMLAVAHRDLTAALPGDALVNYNPDPVTDAWRHLQSLLDDQLHVRSAISVLQQCLQKYSLDEVCVCFNGGKDCTAVLHLLHALVNKDCSADSADDPPRRIRAVYIRDPKPFPEMEQFVQETTVRYNLDLLTTSGPMKPGLERMLQHWPALKACVMGTRQGDPHSDSMCTFHATDSDWPSLMRVNAILSWDYQQLWQFLRQLSLPYCSLYDRGYTSLGSVDNTLPNPSLQRQRPDGSVTYRPAHELADGSLERAGRIKAS